MASAPIRRRVLLATLPCLVVFLSGCGGGHKPARSKPVLPSPMIAGYTSGASQEKITTAVTQGANVIFWSFMNLKGNQLVGGLTPESVGPTFQALAQMGRSDVLHFVSFGGWGPDHSLAGTCGSSPCSGEAYAAAFRVWNDNFTSHIPGFPGFAGIDWDIEGTDTLDSPSNEFSMEAYEVMLNMTKALNDDFLVSMVPPQSYFNCQTSGFDSTLRHASESMPNFTYAGLNAYTALFAKCPSCFDMVMVQLYESYSTAGFDLYWDGNASNVGKSGFPREGSTENMQSVIKQNLECLSDGFNVDFNGFWGLENQKVVVPASQVVIALANGWAVPEAPHFKAAYFAGGPSGDAWCSQESTARARGFVYWDIGDYSLHNVSLVKDLAAAMGSCGSNSIVV